MAYPIYDWTRFWAPPGTRYELYRGFLADPEQAKGYVNKALKTGAELASFPCLGLLGEPGIGKTTELRLMAEAARELDRAQPSQVKVCEFNLRAYQSAEHLCRDLFEGTDILSWQASDSQLHLFLDSLDEGLLEINTLANLIVDRLARLPLERLLLRIGCRSGVWPAGLTEELSNLWIRKVGPSRQCELFTLAPLRYRDVLTAAQVEFSKEAERFMTEVSDVEVVPLAIAPVTLRLLTTIFKENEALPPSKVEVYRRGCELLANEVSESRQRKGIRSQLKLNSSQRMMLAGRIAAATVFGNKQAVYTGAVPGNCLSTDTHIEALEGQESLRGGIFTVGREALEELLELSGLFRPLDSKGSSRMGWWHQTYAEFLAAWYLSKHRLALPRVLQLLTLPPEHHVIPQLHETAIWAAALIPELRSHILEVEPELLLSVDPTYLPESERKTLTASLLAAYAEGRLLDHLSYYEANFDRLAHGGLANQLRPYLLDRSHNNVVRRVCVHIAEACRVADLQFDLITMALDPVEEPGLRRIAAHALLTLGDDESRRALIPLAKGEAGADPDDDLRGTALQALWPFDKKRQRLISSEELFQCLSWPQRTSPFGSYNIFLKYTLVGSLQREDLPFALPWVASRGVHRRRDDHQNTRNIDGQILEKAWNYVDDPPIAAAFIDTVFELRATGHEVRLPAESMLSSLHPRRDILSQLLRDDRAARRNVWELIGGVPGLIQEQDLGFLLEQHHREDAAVRTRIIEALRYIFRPEDPEHWPLLYATCEDSPELTQAFRYWLGSVVIDSDDARKSKEEYERHNAWRNERHVEPEAVTDPDRWVAEALDAAETNPMGWYNLLLGLTLEPGDTHFGDPYAQGVIHQPGWKRSAVDVQRRISAVALLFLQEWDPNAMEWLGKTSYPTRAPSGLCAGELLLNTSPERLRNLPSQVWIRWAPVFVRFSDHCRDEIARKALLSLVLEHAPKTALEVALYLVDHAIEGKTDLYSALRLVERVWCGPLADALLHRFQTGDLTGGQIRALLSTLLLHNVPGAEAAATSSISIPFPTDEARAKAASVAAVLVERSPATGLNFIWPLFEVDPDFAHQAITRIARGSDRGKIPFETVSAALLGSLFRWLMQHYPPAEDPVYNQGEFHEVTVRDKIAQLRNEIPAALQRRASADDVRSLELLAQEFPKTGLRWTALEARVQLRRGQWEPLPWDRICTLIQEKGKEKSVPRLIQPGVGEPSMQQVVEAMSPEGWSGVYVIGSFDHRITFYAQQSRALTLIRALFETRGLKAGQHVAVVGGGASGVTAAVAAASKGCEVTLYEAGDAILHLQASCEHRYIHPHLYDWPQEGSDNDDAGLPLVNWHASTAKGVVEQIRKGVETFVTGNSRLRVRTGSKISRLYQRSKDIDARRVRVVGNEGDIDDDFHVVIVAVGFGSDAKSVSNIVTPSYWHTDGLEGTGGSRADILVSGAGDGGLIDVARACIQNFDHARLLTEVMAIAAEADIVGTLLEIEQQALDAKQHGSPAVKIYKLYADRLTIPEPLLERLKIQKRSDTHVVFNFHEPEVFKVETALINRLLVFLLIKAGLVKRKLAVMAPAEVHPSGRVRVKWDGEEDSTGESDFQRVILRHGPPSGHVLTCLPDLKDGVKPLRGKLARLALTGRLHPTTRAFYEGG